MVDFKIGDKVYMHGNPKKYARTIGYCVGTISNIRKEESYVIVNFNIINGNTRHTRCVVYLEDLHLFCNKKGNAVW